MAFSPALCPELAGLVRELDARGSYRRILFVTANGDVEGSHAHWRAGRDDPSIPSLAYSSQIYELAEALGAQLTVLNNCPPGPGAPGERTRFRNSDLRQASGIRYHLSELGYVLRVIGQALACRADTILFQRHLVHFWPLALARLFGIRLVVSLHNTLWPAHRTPSLRDRVIGRLNGWFFRRCAGVLTVSAAARRQVLQVAGPGLTSARVQVPQYRTDLARAYRPRASGRRLEQILYLGRIEDDKGVFDLLDAFAMVAPAHPRLRLRFVGAGSAEEHLRGAADALPASIARRIETPGPVPGEGVFAELGAADLLVCPTTGRFAEGLAKTPIEAAIMGVPSLVTSVVPVAEILGGAVARVPADNVSALAARLDGLARSPAELAAMSEAASDCRAGFFDRSQSLASQLLVSMALAADRRLAPPQPGSASGTVPALGWKATSG